MDEPNERRVEIRQVGNGYMVFPAPDYMRGEGHRSSDVMVFRTFVELIEWLAQTFSYRSGPVPADKMDAA